MSDSADTQFMSCMAALPKLQDCTWWWRDKEGIRHIGELGKLDHVVENSFDTEAVKIEPLSAFRSLVDGGFKNCQYCSFTVLTDPLSEEERHKELLNAVAASSTSPSHIIDLCRSYYASSIVRAGFGFAALPRASQENIAVVKNGSYFGAHAWIFTRLCFSMLLEPAVIFISTDNSSYGQLVKLLIYEKQSNPKAYYRDLLLTSGKQYLKPGTALTEVDNSNVLATHLQRPAKDDKLTTEIAFQKIEELK